METARYWRNHKVSQLTEMIRAQNDLQRQMGFKFEQMDEETRLTYIFNMYVAAMKELGEAIDETPWKFWAKRRPFNVDAFVAELSDTFQFIINMWCAALPERTADDIAKRMYSTILDKIEINKQRIADGYDAKSTKCVQCKRALDDPAVRCWRIDDQAYCAQYDVDVNLINTAT